MKIKRKKKQHHFVEMKIEKMLNQKIIYFFDQNFRVVDRLLRIQNKIKS